MNRAAIQVRPALVALASSVLLFSCATSPASGDGDDSFTIAFLRAVPGSGASERSMLNALRSEGYVIGANLTLLAPDTEEAYPDEEDAKAVLEEWRREGVDLIVAFSTVGARAASEVAPEVPTLFLANDPIATDLVENAERPEGSLTGVTFRVPADRTLDLIHRAIPGLSAVGLAYPPDDPAAIAHRDEVLSAAETLDIQVIVEPFRDADDIGEVVSGLADRGVEALLLSRSPTATQLLDEFQGAASSAGLPVIDNTGLAPWAILSLYPDLEETGRQLGRQAIRLLSGSNPASIPVEDPRRLILELNAMAAADHGIRFSEELMREADTVRMP